MITSKQGLEDQGAGQLSPRREVLAGTVVLLLSVSSSFTLPELRSAVFPHKWPGLAHTVDFPKISKKEWLVQHALYLWLSDSKPSTVATSCNLQCNYHQLIPNVA